MITETFVATKSELSSVLQEMNVRIFSDTSTITKIGIAAGEIWTVLDEEDPLEFSLLTSRLSQNRVITLMALGWLCREGHVLMLRTNGKLFVMLSERSKE